MSRCKYYHYHLTYDLIFTLYCFLYFDYKLLYLLLKSNTLALLLAILVGVVVYGALVLLTGTIRKEEIRKLPKGEKLLKLLDRFVK